MIAEEGTLFTGDEDEVVRELDVFVNNDLKLYLGQFPLKPVYSDPLNVQSVRYKPNHHKLELNVPYPQSVQNALAKEHGSHSLADSQQKFESTDLPQQNPLMVGFIQNNNFIISSVDNVLQFHPVMNKAHSILKVETILETEADFDTAVRNELDYDDETTANLPSSSNPDNVKQIQLKRKESERAQSARLQSYSYLKQQEDMEQWVGLKPFPVGMNFLSLLLFRIFILSLFYFFSCFRLSRI
jgi:hypothetical protein